MRWKIEKKDSGCLAGCVYTQINTRIALQNIYQVAYYIRPARTKAIS